ncbi:MAG: hypothetical protein QOG42_1003 [Solirubrobacteraceae bacterium]|jgi:uncharacterized protein YkwD|nr:hypothetical protein [Solirubrobacteraceae bacterium]
MPRLKPALALALLALAVGSPAAASAATGDPVLDTEEKAFCTKINQYRAQNGRAALRVSVSLTNAAKWMSNDLATKNYFSHTDSLGRAFGTRLGVFGYAFSTYKGENIAAGSSTAASTFEQWRTSSAHNANMLNASYTVIGIGRAYSAASTYKWYWTTDFGGYADRTIAC